MSEESRAMRAPNALRRPNKFVAYMRKYWFVYMLALPGLIFMIVFNYGPMYGIQLAFKDYKMNLGVWGSPWVGLKHYRELFADPVFIQAFKNTVIINVYNLIFGFSFNVFLALMINEIHFRKLKSDRAPQHIAREKRGADGCLSAVFSVLGHFCWIGSSVFGCSDSRGCRRCRKPNACGFRTGDS